MSDNCKELRELVRKHGSFSGVERAQLQFLEEGIRGLLLKLKLYEEAFAKPPVQGEEGRHVAGCGCVRVNGVRVHWCGDHY